MKVKLLFATGNEYKFNLMKKWLEVFDNLKLVNPKMLDLNINVVEDGKTAEENSIKKAKAYFEVTGLPVIAEDSGLFIDKFKIEEQPGLFVKRVNGKEGLSDEKIFNYYLNKITEYGGESKAHYFNCLEGFVTVQDYYKKEIIHDKTISEPDFDVLERVKKHLHALGKIDLLDLDRNIIYNCKFYKDTHQKYLETKQKDKEKEEFILEI